MVIKILTFSLYEMCFKVMKFIFFLTQTSLRQMNQTRFYIVENNISTVRVHLFVGGLPLHLTPEEYTKILKDELAIKSTSDTPFPHVFFNLHKTKSALIFWNVLRCHLFWELLFIFYIHAATCRKCFNQRLLI